MYFLLETFHIKEIAAVILEFGPSPTFLTSQTRPFATNNKTLDTDTTAPQST